MDETKKEASAISLKSFLIELAVYAVFVVAYFFLVLSFLDKWFKDLYDHQRWTYAFVGLAIVLTQAAVLEAITSGLLRYIRSKTDSK